MLEISKQRAIEYMAKGKDVPAVENPDFKQAVADMIEKDEEKQAPPPDGAGRCSSSGETKADVQEKV